MWQVAKARNIACESTWRSQIQVMSAHALRAWNSHAVQGCGRQCPSHPALTQVIEGRALRRSRDQSAVQHVEQAVAKTNRDLSDEDKARNASEIAKADTLGEGQLSEQLQGKLEDTAMDGTRC